ncbi:cell wall hydrolase [Xanthobacter sp. TB0139]|uniref:cell wall hydrolase n=1 Tax=Xanthobacter sp. TB0139 TaxID=3459178 RepID=UPI0040393015
MPSAMRPASEVQASRVQASLQQEGQESHLSRLLPSSLASPLASPMRTLKVATLDLPRPVGTRTGMPGIDTFAASEDPDDVAPLPSPSIFVASGEAFQTGPSENRDAFLGLALDLALELPIITADGADLAASYGALAERLGGSLPFGSSQFFPGDAASAKLLPEGGLPLPLPAGARAPQSGEVAPLSPAELSQAIMSTQQALSEEPFITSSETPLYHDPKAIFGSDPDMFPALAFEYQDLADHGLVPLPLPRPADIPALSPAHLARTEGGIWPSPADRLGLKTAKLAKARKCLAEAIYFESRGEPKRGQIAVAQVIVNRVFSGYYPADICGTVYQNAHRHLSCQFTFACDNVKDVIREPEMWTQANDIAADMLNGKLWLESVGRATHYHAHWVHPRWVREMRKLDRIGVHTFYRPRRWSS